jgi:hypothetical protein
MIEVIYLLNKISFHIIFRINNLIINLNYNNKLLNLLMWKVNKINFYDYKECL